MKILISGGTGLLGSKLIEELLRRGHEVVLLTRKSLTQTPFLPVRQIQWPLKTNEKVSLIKPEFNQSSNADQELTAINDCDAFINLAGESIAGFRWTKKKKDLIKKSRIQFTENILNHLKQSSKLHTVISSSAIGFYGDRKSEVLTEDSPSGTGFLAEVCLEWEMMALTNIRKDQRAVIIRTGIVLTREGSLLKEVEPIYKSHLGGRLGDGNQFMSWIHINDWVNAVIFCFENKNVSGAVNLVAPEPVTNYSFNAVLCDLFQQKIQLPVPSPALKLAMGEASHLALDSQNVRPEKLLRLGFKFQFPYLKEAIANIYNTEHFGHNVYELYTSSAWLPHSKEKIMTFFSDLKNSLLMFPKEMKMSLYNTPDTRISRDSVFEYDYKVFGISQKWQGQIKVWDPPHKFVDTLIRGPFSFWEHTHSFESLAGGTLVKDQIHYKMPLGFLGRIGGLKIAQKQLNDLFAYRKKIIHQLF
jgi:uncharacterized protein (TIGR01777 family)